MNKSFGPVSPLNDSNQDPQVKDPISSAKSLANSGLKRLRQISLPGTFAAATLLTTAMWIASGEHVFETYKAGNLHQEIAQWRVEVAHSFASFGAAHSEVYDQNSNDSYTTSNVEILEAAILDEGANPQSKWSLIIKSLQGLTPDQKEAQLNDLEQRDSEWATLKAIQRDFDEQARVSALNDKFDQNPDFDPNAPVVISSARTAQEKEFNNLDDPSGVSSDIWRDASLAQYKPHHLVFPEVSPVKIEVFQMDSIDIQSMNSELALSNEERPDLIANLIDRVKNSLGLKRDDSTPPRMR